MAGMMVPMVRVVSPFILERTTGRLTCTLGRNTDSIGMTTRLGRSRRGFGLGAALCVEGYLTHS